MPKTLWTVLATLIVLALVAFCQAKGAPETRPPSALRYQSASFRMRPLLEDLPPTTTIPPASSPAPAPPPPTTHVESTHIPTAARPAPLPAAGRPAGPAQLGRTLTVVSTAYSGGGHTASGKVPYVGEVAMNGIPFGTRFLVLSGSFAGRTVVVEDRYGWGTQCDFYVGSEAEASRYGRQTIELQQVN